MSKSQRLLCLHRFISSVSIDISQTTAYYAQHCTARKWYNWMPKPVPLALGYSAASTQKSGDSWALGLSKVPAPLEIKHQSLTGREKREKSSLPQFSGLPKGEIGQSMKDWDEGVKVQAGGPW